MSLSSITFPDVPFAPGVPNVLRSVLANHGNVANSVQNIALGAAQQVVSGIVSNAQNAINGGVPSLINGAFGQLPSLLTGDAPSVQNAASNSATQWGIFDQSGTQVLTPTSFKSIGYKQGWRIANYPMEQGAFQNYNKVQTPFENSIVVTQGGKLQDRQDFLDTLDTIANSFDLYNVVTPDRTYHNVSIEDYDYQRSATNGNGLLTVEIKLLEIRESPSAAFVNTAAPSGQDAVNDGTVQATPVTTADNVTTDSVESAVEGGASVASAVSAGIATATSMLPTAAISAITGTLTPAIFAQVGPLALSISPISASVSLQLPTLLRIQ